MAVNCASHNKNFLSIFAQIILEIFSQNFHKNFSKRFNTNNKICKHCLQLFLQENKKKFNENDGKIL